MTGHTSGSGPMRPFGDLVSVADALSRWLGACRPVEGTESLLVGAAAGRVAAERVAATAPVPAFARAVMDGYACRAAELASASADRPARLRLAGAIHAGQTGGPLAPGTCTQIATGGPLPPGADTVAPVEDTGREGETVAIRRAFPAGANWSPAGSDFVAGEVAVEAGQWLSPARLGAVAAVGRAALAVRRRPTVAILGSGDEVRPAGSPLALGQVHDVNGPTLGALVAAHGGLAVGRPTLPDDPAEVSRSLGMIHADLLVFAGGTSVGERDVVGQVLAREAEVLFHGVALKPGKPTMAARLGNRLVLGLPGNPTSCLMMAYVFLVPALRALAGLPPWTPRRVAARLSAAVRSPVDKHHYVPVRLEGATATSVMKESGAISSLSRADGWIEIPVGTDHLDAGAAVEVVCWS